MKLIVPFVIAVHLACSPISGMAEEHALRDLAIQFADIRDWDNAGCEGSTGTINQSRADAITKAIGGRGADPTFLKELELAMRDFDDSETTAICEQILMGNPALFSPLQK